MIYNLNFNNYRVKYNTQSGEYIFRKDPIRYFMNIFFLVTVSMLSFWREIFI